MSEHVLPDNPSDWPLDPFQLLGVDPDADANALRRAYNRLLRLYRPEDRPDEFQRIRAAYEQTKQFAEHRRAFLEREPAFPERDTPEDEPPRAERPTSGGAGEGEPRDASPAENERRPEDRAPSDAARSPSPRPSSPRSSPDDRMSAAWETARNGDPVSAYATFRALRNERPADPAPILRLYWLLVIAREVDADREPADWLCDGLRSCGFASNLAALYERELEREPAIVGRESGRSLLALAPAARAGDLAAPRWRAAARSDQWDVIERDLDDLRPRLSLDAPVAWARLLFVAIDHLAFGLPHKARSLLKVCRSELDALRTYELELSQEFEQLARLDEFTAAPLFLSEHDGAELLLELIRESWRRTAWELRGLLMATVETWVREPVKALALLDDLRKASPAGMEQVERLVKQAPIPWHVIARDRRAESHRRLIQEFLEDEIAADYAQWRGRLLEFCLHEAATPAEVVAHLCDDATFVNSDETARRIDDDVGLHCVQTGCMAFLSQTATM